MKQTEKEVWFRFAGGKPQPKVLDAKNDILRTMQRLQDAANKKVYILTHKL